MWKNKGTRLAQKKFEEEKATGHTIPDFETY